MSDSIIKFGGTAGQAAYLELLATGALSVYNSSGAAIMLLSATGDATFGATVARPVDDRFVNAAIAVADSASGVATVLATVTLTRLNSSVLTSARQVLIRTGAAAYAPQALNGTTTFGTATSGAIVASGTGWQMRRCTSSSRLLRARRTLMRAARSS